MTAPKTMKPKNTERVFLIKIKSILISEKQPEPPHKMCPDLDVEVWINGEPCDRVLDYELTEVPIPGFSKPYRPTKT